MMLHSSFADAPPRNGGPNTRARGGLGHRVLGVGVWLGRVFSASWRGPARCAEVRVCLLAAARCIFLYTHACSVACSICRRRRDL
jgi:hypothetical protein